jgi:hypothetical protein
MISTIPSYKMLNNIMNTDAPSGAQIYTWKPWLFLAGDFVLSQTHWINEAGELVEAKSKNANSTTATPEDYVRIRLVCEREVATFCSAAKQLALQKRAKTIYGAGRSDSALESTITPFGKCMHSDYDFVGPVPLFVLDDPTLLLHVLATSIGT